MEKIGERLRSHLLAARWAVQSHDTASGENVRARTFLRPPSDPGASAGWAGALTLWSTGGFLWCRRTSRPAARAESRRARY
jgi:hypothetical protein